MSAFIENLIWVPFLYVPSAHYHIRIRFVTLSLSFFFFGGLAIPVSQALLAHCFSYNITWGATKKEVERSNFFKEVPKIFKRFWFSWLISWTVLAGMVILSTPLVPIEWRIDGSAWAVIFPLAIVVGCHILFPVSISFDHCEASACADLSSCVLDRA